jgi:hypothetical protein
LPHVLPLAAWLHFPPKRRGREDIRFYESEAEAYRAAARAVGLWLAELGDEADGTATN